MIVDGRSLACLLAFGLALVASDPKCFELTGNKTVLKGNCKGSEMLVVTSKKLNVELKYPSAIDKRQKLKLEFGTCELLFTFDAPDSQARLATTQKSWFLPINLVVLPEKAVIKKKGEPNFDAPCAPKFEPNEQKNGTFKIQVKYEADSPSDLGGLTMTFDATIFTPVEKADYSRYIWIAIAVGVVALIVGVSISVCCYRRHKKPKTEDQKSKASKSKTNKSGNKSTSQQTPAPPPIIMNATKVRTERSAYQGDDDIVDSEYFIKRQFQEDVL